MAYVDDRADCALAGIEIGPDCVEGGIFHDGTVNLAGLAALARTDRGE
jgi:hypothetical protein